MLGKKSGVVQRIRDLTHRPWIVGIHCYGHRLELAYKDILKAKINLFQKVDILLLNIYYFYRNSNVNRSQLKECYKIVNKKILLPSRVGGTRWMDHFKRALLNFVNGFEAFILHLGQLQNPDVVSGRSEKGNKAKNMYTVIKSQAVWFMLHFLLDCLSILVRLSEVFQRRTTTLSEVASETEMGMKGLEKLKTSDGFYLREAAETSHSLTSSDKSFSSSRTRFIDAIVSALKERLVAKSGVIGASSVANLSFFPSSKEDLKDYGDASIIQLVDYFQKALADAGVETDKVESEWTGLKQHLSSRFRSPNLMSWEEVWNSAGHLFSNVLALMDLVNTIPASSADAERAFNRLKLAKNDWRSTFSDSHLFDQLMIMLESPEVANFDPVPAISLWNSKSRRLRNSGKVAPLPLSARGTVSVEFLEQGVREVPKSVDETLTSQYAHAQTAVDKDQRVHITVTQPMERTHPVPVTEPNRSLQSVNVQTELSLLSRTVTDVSTQTDDNFIGVFPTVPLSDCAFDEDYESDDDYATEKQDFTDEGLFSLSYHERIVAAKKAYSELCSIACFHRD